MLPHMTHLMIDTDGSIKHLSEESHHFIALWKSNTEQHDLDKATAKNVQPRPYISIMNKPSDLLQYSDIFFVMELMYS